MVLFQSLLSLIIQNQRTYHEKGRRSSYGSNFDSIERNWSYSSWLNFPILGFSFGLVEYIKPLPFLRGNKASWLVFTLSAVAAAALTLEIWLYFHLPLV
jgi:hypothetical protein